MYQVSQAYKESMKSPIRNQSYVKVILGLINQEAQNTSNVLKQAEYMDFSNYESIFEKNDIGNEYATYEQDFFKCDGSLYFLPREQYKRKKNGITKKELFNTSTMIEISIGYGRTDIKGMSIMFGENYPTNFSIVTSNGVEKVFTNNNQYFETDIIFADTDKITIKINSMYKPNGRVRLYYIKFGLGLEYDNEYIKSTQSVNKLSVINEELPEINFQVTLKNEDQRFNVDNPSSEINFLETGQKISVIYGYMLDDGTMEMMQQHEIIVSDWNADDEKATIKAVDKFRYMSDNYYKGKYYDTGITLYDLAIEVLKDAGIGSDQYYLDSYLKKVTVNNPLPNVTHKEALQIIANAGRCVMDYDRYGRIRIYSMFIPGYTTTSNGTQPYSDINSIDTDTAKESYATYEKNYWTVDGTMIFVPKTGFKEVGYISEQISDSMCKFVKNPLITRTMEAKYKCFGIKIKFIDVLPKQFKIKTYMSGLKNDELLVNKDIVLNYELNYEFKEFDKMEIEFIETETPNTRIHIGYISFGEESNYRIEYDDLYTTPVGIKLENIKNINSARNIYTKSEKEEELMKDSFAYDGKNHVYYMSEPCYGYSVTVNGIGQNAEILESGAYYIVVHFKNITIGQSLELSVKGKKYNVTSEKITMAVGNRGINKEWSNPLISDVEHCKSVSQWLADYFSSGIEYELDYRGEPAIDVGDTIFQENRYEPNLKVIVEESQLTFNGGISGALRTRRKEHVVRTKNKLGNNR